MANVKWGSRTEAAATANRRRRRGGMISISVVNTLFLVAAAFNRG